MSAQWAQLLAQLKERRWASLLVQETGRQVCKLAWVSEEQTDYSWSAEAMVRKKVKRRPIL